MTVFSPNMQVSDQALVGAIREKAALVEAETEAGLRFAEGSAVREWHLERAEKAKAELLGLINHPLHRAGWERIESRVAPAWPLRSAAALAAINAHLDGGM